MLPFVEAINFLSEPRRMAINLRLQHSSKQPTVVCVKNFFRESSIKATSVEVSASLLIIHIHIYQIASSVLTSFNTIFSCSLFFSGVKMIYLENNYKL